MAHNAHKSLKNLSIKKAKYKIHSKISLMPTACKAIKYKSKIKYKIKKNVYKILTQWPVIYFNVKLSNKNKS